MGAWRVSPKSAELAWFYLFILKVTLIWLTWRSGSIDMWEQIFNHKREHQSQGSSTFKLFRGDSLTTIIHFWKKVQPRYKALTSQVSTNEAPIRLVMFCSTRWHIKAIPATKSNYYIPKYGSRKWTHVPTSKYWLIFLYCTKPETKEKRERGARQIEQLDKTASPAKSHDLDYRSISHYKVWRSTSPEKPFFEGHYKATT